MSAMTVVWHFQNKRMDFSVRSFVAMSDLKVTRLLLAEVAVW